MHQEIIRSIFLRPHASLKCPRCHEKLLIHNALLTMAVRGDSESIIIACSYCTFCKRYYASAEEIRTLRTKIALQRNAKSDDIVFTVNFKYSNGNPASGLSEKRKRETAISLAGRKFDLLPREHVINTNTVRNVWLTPVKFTRCPICSKGLNLRHTVVIPVSKKACIKYTIPICYSCKAFFSHENKLLKKLANVCTDKTQLLLHDVYCQDVHKYQNTIDLRRIPSAYCRIVLSTEEHVRIITIVTKHMDANPQIDCYHYSDRAMLYLLTALFLNESTVKYNDKRYIIQDCVYTELEETGFRFLCPSDSLVVETRKNGGYYDVDEHLQQVDGLFFCEKSDCLEIMHMTYDPALNLYYVDRHIYQEFLSLHGYPIIDNYVEQDRDEYTGFRLESLLHQLGYNVSDKDNQSMLTRQQKLSRFVDLGLIDISSIVTLLQSFIRRNGVRSPSSCIKWEDDLEYIKNYKVNHERFAFVHYVRSKLQ